MFGDRWQQILARQGGQTALWHPGGKMTFGELDAAARALHPGHCPQLGAFFLAQGDGLEVLLALLAGFLSGLPVQVVEKDRSRRVPRKAAPAGTALVKQTVGGSGLRRCQFFSLAQIAADVGRLHASLGLGRHGVALAPLSVAHSFGLTTTVLQTLFHGVPTHWMATPFPTCMKPALDLHERAFLPGVPAMWKAWLMARPDFSRVSLAICAGSPLTTELEAKVKEVFGLKLHNLYGTSECGAISYDATAEPRADAADLGSLLPGVHASVQSGRLLVESDAVGLGYDDALPDEVMGDGRHLTWDLVHVEDGRLKFLSCMGAGINVASRKLSPDDIATKIRQATGVAEVKVHGQPSRDPERVQDVVAWVRLPQAELTQEFKVRACAALAPWEVPRHWRALG